MHTPCTESTDGRVRATWTVDVLGVCVDVAYAPAALAATGQYYYWNARMAPMHLRENFENAAIYIERERERSI